MLSEKDHGVSIDKEYFCINIFALIISICNPKYYFVYSLDIQATSAVVGDGLYEGLDWLHSTLTGKAVKDAVSKPISETKSTSKDGLLSSLYSNITSYFTAKS